MKLIYPAIKRSFFPVILGVAVFFCSHPIHAQSQPFTSSNLPVIVINTNGAEIPDEPKIPASMGIIYNGPGVRNNISDPFNEYNGNIGIEIRGQSSQIFPMKSYSIELWDELQNSIDSSLLGMPAESDWVLYAPYTDKTLMRNFLAYTMSRELGNYASRCRYVEVVINGDYKGVYILEEKIKRGSDRVPIKKMADTDISGDKLTGGYIFKIDKKDPDEEGWYSSYAPNGSINQAIEFIYVYPKTSNIVQQQKDYLKGYVDSFENALHGPDFQDPATGYRKYADVKSFVDYFIINEVSRNIDGYRLSSYFYKDRYSLGGKLKAGPVWDYDLAFRNANYCNGSDITGWAYQLNNVCAFKEAYLVPFWWDRFMEDSAFTSSLRCRWLSARQNSLSNERLFFLIDSVNTLLSEAQQRHFERWPVLGQYVWPNPYPIPTTYAGEINTLKDWLTQRLNWIDNNIPNTGSCATLPASIGDFVWNDLNGNGIQDNGEPGIGNVAVNLYTCTNNFVATTTTNGNGYYEFTGLTPGSYFVEFTAPSGYFFSPVNVGTDDKNNDADPDTPRLTGRGQESTASVNLTTEGTSDWAHWTGYIHKSTGGSLISNYSVVGTGTANDYYNDLRTYSWSDGAPVTSGSDANGIYISGIGNGFQLTVPADLLTRTLKLYVGGWQSRGKLIAHLSDGSSPDFQDASFSGVSQYAVVYTLTYKAASAGQTLTVQWVQNAGEGNVTLNGATLSVLTGISGKTTCITLGSGENNTSIDAGLNQTVGASLGDYVWNDLNANGIQDVNEPGINGVSVKLFECNGTTPVATTTTANGGKYTFTNLIPGNYYVMFNAPDGFFFSPQGAGSNGALDSDVMPEGLTAVGQQSGDNVDLTAEGTADWAHWSGYDHKSSGAGQITEYTVVGTGSVNNYSNDPRTFSWSDGTPNASGSNQDGIYISGIGNGFELTAPADLTRRTLKVYVGGWNSGGTLTAKLSDGSSPDYTDASFSGAGQYTVVYTLTYKAASPAQKLTVQWVQSSGTGNVTLNGATLSAAPGESGKTACITLSAGENNPDIDAGLYQSATTSIGDFVWNDLNKNGIQDANEPGIDGVTVKLYACGSNTPLATTTTANGGSYSFTNLLPGSYYVKFTAPQGYVFSPKNAGTDITKDSDADPDSGGMTATGQKSSAAVNLTLEGTADWAHWDGYDHKSTGSSQISNYSVVGSGTVKTYSNDPRTLNWSDGTPNASGSNTNGIYISGTGNGFGLSAPADLTTRTLKIYAGGWNSGGTFTAQLSDGSAADYVNTSFAAAGQYNVVYTITYKAASAGQSIKVKWVQSSGTGNVTLNGATLAVTTGESGKTACVMVGAGESNTTVDAGLYQLNSANASLGDLVWNDLNKNGIQDASEPGVDGVKVELYNCGGTSSVATATTANSGKYSFTNLVPGSYYVKFTAPAGYSFTAKDAGIPNDDSKDSDADPSTGQTTCITLQSGVNNTTVDAGLYQNGGGTEPCSFTQTVNLDPSKSNSYTILADEEVDLDNSKVNGNVGVWQAGKKVKLDNGSVINAYAKAPVIELKNNSTIIGTQYLAQAPQPAAASFRYNTMPEPPSDITVPDNYSGVYPLTGNNFKKITVGKNATAKFMSSGDIFIKELKTSDADDGKTTNLEFSGNTELMVRKTITFGKNTNVNQVGSFSVKIYEEENDVRVMKSSKIKASIDGRFHNLNVDDATEMNHTVMTGQFIAKKVDSKKWVDWNGLCQTSTTTVSGRGINIVADKNETQVTELRSAFSASVYPNPSNGDFNIKVTSLQDEPIMIRILDLSGRTLMTQTTKYNKTVNLGSRLSTGTYYAEVMQGANRKILKLVKLK